MPHSTRKNRRNVSKRVEVTTDDGWTTITTTKASQRAPRHKTNGLVLHDGVSKAVPEDGVTIEVLQQKFAKIEQSWLSSEAYRTLNDLLKKELGGSSVTLDKLIVFGTGSTCGERGRHHVALLQLAVLKGVAATIELLTESPVTMHAQDPIYNALDEQFVESLGYRVVNDPNGFKLITDKSLVYTPGAELNVELLVLGLKPAVLLCGKLDWFWRNPAGIACTNRVKTMGSNRESTVDAMLEDRPDDKDSTVADDYLEEGCRVFESFVQSKQEIPIPTYDDKDYPFYRQFLYWPKPSAAPDGDGAGTSPALTAE